MPLGLERRHNLGHLHFITFFLKTLPLFHRLEYCPFPRNPLHTSSDASRESIRLQGI
jgi:hypothetical protein